MRQPTTSATPRRASTRSSSIVALAVALVAASACAHPRDDSDPGKRAPRRRSAVQQPAQLATIAPANLPVVATPAGLASVEPARFPLRHITDVWPDLLETKARFASTRFLRSRSPGENELLHDVRVDTTCRSTGCEDSLTWQGQVLIARSPTPSDGDDPNLQADRYVEVLRNDGEFLSINVATQSYYAGAAHYVYDMHCRTFRAGHRKPAKLADVMGKASARLLLRKLPELFNPCDGGTGSHLPCSQYRGEDRRFVAAGQTDFRLEDSPCGNDFRVVVCQPSQQGDGTEVREIPLDQVPATLLLQ